MNSFYFIFHSIYSISARLQQRWKEYWMKPKHTIIPKEVRGVVTGLLEQPRCMLCLWKVQNVCVSMPQSNTIRRKCGLFIKTTVDNSKHFPSHLTVQNGFDDNGCIIKWTNLETYDRLFTWFSRPLDGVCFYVVIRNVIYFEDWTNHSYHAGNCFLVSSR